MHLAMLLRYFDIINLIFISVAYQFQTHVEDNQHLARRIGFDMQLYSIGTQVRYQNQKGLMHTQLIPPFIYRPQDFASEFGFWAYFIYPTVMAESKGSFLCLNTYDRAAFTFGIMQYAAHVPNGDFVRWFRAILSLPNAADYFPILALNEGRIWLYQRNLPPEALEDDASTARLMWYLNQDPYTVDKQELLCAARMIHWAMSDVNNRYLQVAFAVKQYQKNMKAYAQRYNLDGYLDKVCFMVCDIRHQGRANSQTILNALQHSTASEQYQALLNIGASSYPERIQTLKQTIANLENAGILGKKHYHQAEAKFV